MDLYNKLMEMVITEDSTEEYIERRSLQEKGYRDAIKKIEKGNKELEEIINNCTVSNVKISNPLCNYKVSYKNISSLVKASSEEQAIDIFAKALYSNCSLFTPEFKVVMSKIMEYLYDNNVFSEYDIKNVSDIVKIMREEFIPVIYLTKSLPEKYLDEKEKYRKNKKNRLFDKLKKSELNEITVKNDIIVSQYEIINFPKKGLFKKENKGIACGIDEYIDHRDIFINTFSVDWEKYKFLNNIKL